MHQYLITNGGKFEDYSVYGILNSPEPITDEALGQFGLALERAMLDSRGRRDIMVFVERDDISVAASTIGATFVFAPEIVADLRIWSGENEARGYFGWSSQGNDWSG